MTTIIHNPRRTVRLAMLRRCMGSWAFTRYLRNQGLSFETTLFIICGTQSR